MDPDLKSASPNVIRPNPENPRLIFKEKELLELEASISENNILVPLTVFETSPGQYVLLDGERRWRCAKKLGLLRVPIIVQPEPTLMQNIMMMFAIHNARSDWEPLPTAQKLGQLSEIYEREEGHPPTEAALAQLASMSRSEVRRLTNILRLPSEYLDIVREEQLFTKSQQTISVDQLLEVTRGATALAKRGLLRPSRKVRLERALISKFRANTLRSTVEPRLLSRMARAVERNDVGRDAVKVAVERLISDPTYTIAEAFSDTVEGAEVVHTIELQAARLTSRLQEIEGLSLVRAPDAQAALSALQAAILKVLG